MDSFSELLLPLLHSIPSQLHLEILIVLSVERVSGFGPHYMVYLLVVSICDESLRQIFSVLILRCEFHHHLQLSHHPILIHLH